GSLKGLSTAAEPGRLEVGASLLFLQEHYPAVRQVVGPRKVHTPLGREGHLPSERNDCARITWVHVVPVPDGGGFQQRSPNLLALEADLRAGHHALLPRAGERHLNVVLLILENTQADGIPFTRQMENEVLTGQFDD